MTNIFDINCDIVLNVVSDIYFRIDATTGGQGIKYVERAGPEVFTGKT